MKTIQFLLVTIALFALFLGANAYCNAYPYNDPTIGQAQYPYIVEKNSIMAFSWEVCGDYTETGIIIKENGKTFTKTIPKNSTGKYSYLAPFTDAPAGFQIYAKNSINGKIRYHCGANWCISSLLAQPWQTIIQTAPSNYRMSFAIQQIDLTTLGLDGIKLLTIGNCIDYGLFDFFCGVDILTTSGLIAALVDPADGTVGDAAMIAAKINTINKGANFIKYTGSISKLMNSARKIKLFFNTESVIIKGSDLAYITQYRRILNVNFATGEFTTAFPNLFRQYAKNPLSITINLFYRGIDNSVLEYLFAKGIAPEQILNATKRADSYGVITLMRETWDTHLVPRGHIDQIKAALGLPDARAVEEKIMDTAKYANPKYGDKYVFQNTYINRYTGKCYNLFVVVNGLVNPSIVTAYPQGC